MVGLKIFNHTLISCEMEARPLWSTFLTTGEITPFDVWSVTAILIELFCWIDPWLYDILTSGTSRKASAEALNINSFSPIGGVGSLA